MFQDGLNPVPVKWVYDKKNVPALLVRFDNATDNEPMSALMNCQNWKDGYWDVTEDEWSARSSEDGMVKEYEASNDPDAVVEEDDYDYDE